MSRNGNRLPPGSERPLIELAGAVPIVGGKTFLVCKAAHVTEAPQHQVMSFRDEEGNVTSSVVCGRCQFEFFAGMFGGVVLGKEVTRKEAEWAARDMRREACDAAGVACCELGVRHEGKCQEPVEEPAS